jgi:hypothetical protein
MTRLFLAVAVSVLSRAAQSVNNEFFENKIRPVLASKYYACHSAKLKSPMADLAPDTKARQNAADRETSRLCNCRLRASPYANGCLLARRLVESGVRYVHLYWPTAASRGGMA